LGTESRIIIATQASMKKYSVRPATPDDLEAVYDLIAAQNTNDYGETLLTIDDLRRRWRTMQFETETCMAYDGGRLAGYAELTGGDSPYIYLEDRGNVDLGFQLLGILEKEAVSRKTESATLVTRISEKNKTLLELFASYGYKWDLSFLIMEMTMNEPPESPQWPEGITVRTFILGQDEYPTYEADEEIGRDKGYHQPLNFEGWVARMGMATERFDPSLWLLAVEGDQIAGLALNLHDQSSNTGWVDHLGVRPAWRNRGIGRALLLHTFSEFYRRGVPRVKLSVDAKSLTRAPRLYQNVWMSTVQQYHIYKKELRV
jgi:GNAT superfamily N-acetyltransferase